MCLPLVDGVFAAVVLGGALQTPAGILEVGLLVFGGSATVAVILAEMDKSPREQARIVLGVGAIVITGAAIQSAIAPTIASVLNMAIFSRFAALVILSVAASTASSRLDEYLPGPAIIILLGLVASVSPSSASVTIQTDPMLIAQGVAAASVGVGFALAVALTSPWLRNAVEMDRFRFGSSVALGVLAFTILGVIPETAPVALIVLLVTALLAFDPGRARERESIYRPDDIDITAALSDGGKQHQAGASESLSESTAESPTDRFGGSQDDSERPPWF
jgi:hypothetical protein